jgi:hypothetical protein
LGRVSSLVNYTRDQLSGLFPPNSVSGLGRAPESSSYKNTQTKTIKNKTKAKTKQNTEKHKTKQNRNKTKRKD